MRRFRFRHRIDGFSVEHDLIIARASIWEDSSESKDIAWSAIRFRGLVLALHPGQHTPTQSLDGTPLSLSV